MTLKVAHIDDEEKFRSDLREVLNQRGVMPKEYKSPTEIRQAEADGTWWNHDVYVLDLVSFGEMESKELQERGEKLARIGKRVLFWSSGATCQHVPVGCNGYIDRSPKGVVEVARWIGGQDAGFSRGEWTGVEKRVEFALEALSALLPFGLLLETKGTLAESAREIAGQENAEALPPFERHLQVYLCEMLGAPIPRERVSEREAELLKLFERIEEATEPLCRLREIKEFLERNHGDSLNALGEQRFFSDIEKLLDVTTCANSAAQVWNDGFRGLRVKWLEGARENESGRAGGS